MGVCSFVMVFASPVWFHASLMIFAFGCWIFFFGLWLLGMTYIAICSFRRKGHIPSPKEDQPPFDQFRSLKLISWLGSSQARLTSLRLLLVGGVCAFVGGALLLISVFQQTDALKQALSCSGAGLTPPSVTYNTVVNPFPADARVDEGGRGQPRPATPDGPTNPARPTRAPAPAAAPVDYGWIARIFLLLFFGLALIVVGVLFRNFWPVFLGSALLLSGMMPKLAIEGKIGEVILLKSTGNMEYKTDLGEGNGEPAPGRLVFTPLGQIRNFNPGCADVEGSGCRKPQALEFLDAGRATIARDALLDAICKKEEMVFLVGRTDRVRLSGDLQSRYESNVGLAQDRAEGVSRKITEYCSTKGLALPRLITQVGGPRDTAPFEDKSGVQGSKDDRSVEVGTLEEKQTSKTSTETDEEKKRKETRIGWALFGLAATAVLLIALAIAYSIAKSPKGGCTLSINLTKCTVEIKREEKKEDEPKRTASMS